MKIFSVFGTRPEAIKMCPLIKEMERDGRFESVVCLTAQHREMLDQVMNIFDVKADYDLDLMRRGQTLTSITAGVLDGLDAILARERPDFVLVHGDTTTSASAALAAFYKQIPVGHVEAGLRTYDLYSPYPEELNRRIISQIAAMHFAPTAANRENLLKENVDPARIFVTGNTVIDAFKYTVGEGYRYKSTDLATLPSDKKIITLTAHRRENLGTPLENICRAVKRLALENKDVEIVYPVHPNPAVRETVFGALGNTPGVLLTDPVDVQDMHNLIARSYIVMTDSGGLQEEAPYFGVPVVVLRGNTERPEAVEAGTVVVAGTGEAGVYDVARRLIRDSDFYGRMSRAVNPYGDEKASLRIIRAIAERLGCEDRQGEQHYIYPPPVALNYLKANGGLL